MINKSFFFSSYTRETNLNLPFYLVRTRNRGILKFSAKRVFEIHVLIKIFFGKKKKKKEIHLNRSTYVREIKSFSLSLLSQRHPFSSIVSYVFSRLEKKKKEYHLLWQQTNEHSSRFVSPHGFFFSVFITIIVIEWFTIACEFINEFS